MKITSVTSRPIAGRFLVQVHADDGLIGTAILPRALSERSSKLATELLVDEDARAVSHHWERLAAANEASDGAFTLEIAALDVALWDLKAKLNGEPLWRTLGGLRPKVNTHIRLSSATRTAEALTRACDAIRASGIRGVILAASDDAEYDAATLVALRDTLGRGAERTYLLDGGERWSPKDAIQAICSIERVADLTWIEAPTRAHDFLGLKRIADQVRGAVCSGGRLTSAAEYLPHLHHRSINVVQLDVARLGITAALRIADAAYGFELPIALTASIGNLHAHLASALVYCASMEWSADESVTSDVRLVSGWATAGDAIGHGIALRGDSETSSRP